MTPQVFGCLQNILIRSKFDDLIYTCQIDLHHLLSESEPNKNNFGAGRNPLTHLYPSKLPILAYALLISSLRFCLQPQDRYPRGFDLWARHANCRRVGCQNPVAVPRIRTLSGVASCSLWPATSGTRGTCLPQQVTNVQVAKPGCYSQSC